MVKSAGVIFTKIVCPVINSRVLRRASLVKNLKSGISHPVLLVHAPTGYGKTTAVASFLQDEQIEACWYRLTEEDVEWTRFCRYLVCSLRRRFPSFGDELLQYLECCAPDDQTQLELFYEMWVNHLADLHQEVLLILDDYHLAPHSSLIQSWMERFLQTMPSGFHLVIITRDIPGWDELVTMKVKGRLVEITQRDLSWSEEEIHVYFTDYCQTEPSQHDLQTICRATLGWPVAVRLMAEAVSQQRGLNPLLDSHSPFIQDLFAYLRVEVWNKLPLRVQRLLEEICMLGTFSKQLYREVFGADPEPGWWLEIERRNLFLLRKQGEKEEFHPLFRQFVKGQLRQRAEEFIRMQRLLVKHDCRTGAYEQAIQRLQEDGDNEMLAEALVGGGRQWLEQGQLEKLEKELKRLPDEWKDRYYKLWIYEGEMNRYRCHYDRAIVCYRRAERLARQKDDPLGQSLGLEGQARIYLDTIQPGKAEYFLQCAIQLLDGLEPYEEDKERLQSLIAENFVNIGRVEDADRWLEQRREINSKYIEKELEVRLLLRTGRLQRAKQILEKKKREEYSERSQLLPRSHRETNLLLSLVDCLMGEPDQAKKLAEAGIMQGVGCQVPFVEACGWMRMGHAVQLISNYERRLAAECYQTALELMEDLRLGRGKAEPLMGLSLLYGREGAVDLAAFYGQQALTETESVKDRWLSTMIRLGLGIAAYYGEQWREAARFFSECHEGFVRCGDRYFMTVTLLWQALTAFETEDESTFLKSMEQLIKMMQTGGYEYLVQKRTLFGPRDIQKWAQLLLFAQTKGIEDHYVSFLLSEMGFHNVSSHPGYTLRIQTLGDFRVWLGDDEVGMKDWQRGKAKELFQLLLTRRQSMLTKEEICTLLWSDADPKSAARDFKVALNALNNALEPKRSARSASFFIQRQGSLYGFNLTSGFEMDAVEFERLIQDGLKEKDITKLQSGLELYRGSYLPERRYEDWCFEERERLQSLFIRGAEQLAQIQVEQKEIDSAIHWCERILQEDACWEEAYRLLMYCFYQKNNRPQAIKQYQKCRDMLQKELGVAPMPKTEELFLQMMQGNMIV
ncbi:BTAD domain-containing putative transcriptional regulator [Paenactinomyces guangxiensis]|uniref:Transcriptional regulator n=1 Tax=Paenactinomyces guangxiensis TaxID=1490290 RepID=A0A7W1WSF0_9BACL|nr:BTAD domain-containing putative transcriptional regulator [Paenactinomyces guangxiensis]MBA4495218.1 transcriptional regulator [Paenactinomyces guangxiensis]MBH8592302.1 transcriptional regulator [Paenactinomyces guangxiensis]